MPKNYFSITKTIENQYLRFLNEFRITVFTQAQTLGMSFKKDFDLSKKYHNYNKKSPFSDYGKRALKNKLSGNDLLSHTGNRAVPSAQQSLTTLFGMGRGVTSALKSPDKIFMSRRKMESHYVF